MPFHVVHERDLPHRIKNGVWMWSVFQEKTDLYYNGYLVATDANRSFIVDPPCAGPDTLNGFTPLPKPEFIFLTNANHERAAAEFRERFQIPVYVHEADAPLLSLKPDFTVQDGQELANDWTVIHLPEQKTPGECALYSAKEQTVILGDALLGMPLQQLSLPSEKPRHPDVALFALQKRLGNLQVQAVLVGAGDPVLLEAGSMLKDALLEHRGWP